MGSIQNYALPITHKIYIISSFKIHTVHQKNKTIITTKKKIRDTIVYGINEILYRPSYPIISYTNLRNNCKSKKQKGRKEQTLITFDNEEYKINLNHVKTVPNSE